MLEYSLSHLGDGELLRGLRTLVARERATTAEVLAHIAEVDARRLYLPAAHPSMYSYCVHELGLSEEAAFKRIHAARAAREFPAIFQAVADGRLHLSAVILLAPHLTQETAADLLTAAAWKTKAGIERLLAERHPQPDVPERLEPIPAEPVLDAATAPLTASSQHAPGRVESSAPPSKVAPLSPQTFALQVTIDQATREKLLYAQALLSHRVPGRDIAQVFDRALDALIARLEKQKFGVASRPGPSRPRSRDNPRYIPLQVRREVWERDGGRCTYVSEAGRRCPECSRLEFDHVLEVARGGHASATDIRLRCRAHNQYGAECTFGKAFMARKREEARVAAERRKAARQRATEQAGDVIPWLRRLGIPATEARAAAALCDAMPDASIEERVRRALRYFGRGTTLPAPSAESCRSLPAAGC